MRRGASLAAFRRRSCTYKKRHETKPQQQGMRAYQCHFCGGWHLTTVMPMGSIVNEWPWLADLVRSRVQSVGWGPWHEEDEALT